MHKKLGPNAIYTVFGLLCLVTFSFEAALEGSSPSCTNKINMTEPVPPIIAPDLLESFKTKPTTTIIITFKVGTSDVLKELESKTFPSREERLKAVHDTLLAHADATQKGVIEYLEGQSGAGIKYESKWISNCIIVKNANLQVVEGLLAFNEIKEVHEDKIVAQILNPDPANEGQ